MKCSKTQQTVHRSTRGGIGIRTWAVVLLSGFLLAASATATDAARWTIGHAAMQTDAGAHGQPQVKLSLRNQGKPDRAAVQLFGRWVPTGQAPRRITAQELSMFVLLGRYQREVAMKQTVILTAPLSALGPLPNGAYVLELAVFTGAGITDQGRVVVRSQ